MADWLEDFNILERIERKCKRFQEREFRGNVDNLSETVDKIKFYAETCSDILLYASDRLLSCIKPMTYVNLIKTFELYPYEPAILGTCFILAESFIKTCTFPQAGHEFSRLDVVELAEIFCKFIGKDDLYLTMEKASITVAEIITRDYRETKLKRYNIECLARLAVAFVNWAPVMNCNRAIKIASLNIAHSLVKFKTLVVGATIGEYHLMLAEAFSTWYESHKDMSAVRKVLQVITNQISFLYKLDEFENVKPEYLGSMCSALSRWCGEKRHGPMRSATILIGKHIYNQWTKNLLINFEEDVLWCLLNSFSKWFEKDNQEKTIRSAVFSIGWAVLGQYEQNRLEHYSLPQLLDFVSVFTKWTEKEREWSLKKVVSACASGIINYYADDFTELSYTQLLDLANYFSMWCDEDDDGNIRSLSRSIAQVLNNWFQSLPEDDFKSQELLILARVSCVWSDQDEQGVFKTNVEFIAKLISKRFYKYIFSEYEPNCLCSFAEAFSKWSGDGGIIRSGIIIIATVISRLNFLEALVDFNRENLSGIAFNLSKWNMNEDINCSVRLATHAIADTTDLLKFFDKLKKFRGVHLSKLATAFTQWIERDNEDNSLRKAMIAIAKTVAAHKLLDSQQKLRYQPSETFRLLKAFNEWYKIGDTEDSLKSAISTLLETMTLHTEEGQLENYSFSDLCALANNFSKFFNFSEKAPIAIVKNILVKRRKELLSSNTVDLIQLVDALGSFSKYKDEEGILKELAVPMLAEIIISDLSAENSMVEYKLGELEIITKAFSEWYKNDRHTKRLIFEISKCISSQYERGHLAIYDLKSLACISVALCRWPSELVENVFMTIARTVDNDKLYFTKYDKSVLFDLLKSFFLISNTTHRLLMTRISIAIARIIIALKFQDLHSINPILSSLEELLVSESSIQEQPTDEEIERRCEFQEAIRLIKHAKSLSVQQVKDFRRNTLREAYKFCTFSVDDIKEFDRKYLSDSALSFASLLGNNDGWKTRLKALLKIAAVVNRSSVEELNQFSYDDLINLSKAFCKGIIYSHVTDIKAAREAIDKIIYNYYTRE